MEQDYHKKYNKKYYEKNKKKIKKHANEWRMDNPEKVKSYKKKWYYANKEKCKIRKNEWLKTTKGCLSKKLGHLKRQKRSRTLEFEITLEDLMTMWELQNGQCAISKYPMQTIFNSLFAVSVDRIDPSRGYTKENIQLVCQGINFAKNQYSNQEMIDFWEYRNQIKEA